MTNGRDIGRDTSRPKPFSAPDCDLRGLEWMPLNAADLLDSDLFLMSTGDEFKAAIALICKSWRQVPAGSLPNSDEALAQLSMARDWTSVRTMALHNWVLCSDGRLYHKLVAAKAMEALPHRQNFIEKKTAEAARKDRERKDRKQLFETLRAAGIVLPATTKTTELREQVAKLTDQKGPPNVTPPVTPDVRDASRDMSRLGQGHDTTPQGPNLEHPSSGGVPLPPDATPGPTRGPTPKPTKAAKPAKTDQPSPSVLVWEAYAAAYLRRYKVEPVRNASINGMLAQFVTRVPQEDAPRVAEFFVGLASYAASNHSIKLLLRDAEGLHTRWRTGARDAMPSSETTYQRGQRQAIEQLTGGLVSRKPIEPEVPHGTTASLTLG